MAGVLEKRERRLFLDDTTTLTTTITTHRMEMSGKQSHAAYVIRVQRGPNPDDSWEVSHRYNNFYALYQTLQASGVSLTIPPKKVFGNTERQFLLERQQGLQMFLDQVMAEPVLCRHFEVKKFLDPSNYSPTFYEDALRNVSMFFRSEPTWSVVEPLKDIGWRIRKQYYLIASKTDYKLPNHMLSLCEPGPDCTLGEREMEASFKALTDMRHPYILSPVLANYTGAGMMIVRMFIPTGSLKDAIYSCRPQASVLQKYGHAARGRVLSIPDIAKYGRQVLEALLFLSEKSFPLGHVHAGNVLLDRGNCKLVDIENSLVGVPSLHRHHLIETRRLYSHEAETVYSFGHMLYEMCMGQELKTPTMDSVPPQSLPAGVEPILQRILTTKGIKENFPTLSNLLDDPFFSTVHLPPQEKPFMKVSSKLKEVLKEHLTKMEQRLREEQRKLSQFKRMSKAHESLMSEEEKKKRRKLRKKQLSLQETGEQSYPTTTSLPRQNTIGTSGVSASASVRSKAVSSPAPTTSTNSNSNSSVGSKSKRASSTPKAPPPPSTEPPAPQVDKPPRTSERGALLGSIEGFAKGKLKKVKTNDRSAPKL